MERADVSIGTVCNWNQHRPRMPCFPRHAEPTMPNPDNQPPILNLAGFLPYRLSVLANTVSHTLAHLYDRRFGITIPEWRVIAVLSGGKTMSAGEVATATAMERVQVSRAIGRMLTADLIRREAGGQDRRRADLTLTAKGNAIFAEIAPLALAYQERLTEVLTADEAAQLDRLLNRLQGRAGHLAAGPPPGDDPAGA